MANETVTVTQTVNTINVTSVDGHSLQAGGTIGGALQLNSTLTAGVDDTGYDIKFFGDTASRYIQWDASEDSFELTDNVKLKIGTGDDLQLYHNASNSYIEAITGDLYIGNNTDDGDIIFQSDNGSGGVAQYFRVDGGDTNIVFSKALKLNSVNIDANSNKVTNLANGSASGDAVNVSQLDTKQATITGAATTIDTEDLTASRALTSNASGKVEVSAVTSTELGYLDGVTSAIQTQLDAKQAQPSEGAFANGDKTKLDAIEASADVTDATNVSAAGALMKSGGTMTGTLTLGSGGIDASYSTLSNVSDGSSTQDAVTKGQLDSVNTTATAALPKTGGTMSGAIAMGSSKITGLAEGTANGDALRFEQLRTIKNDQTNTTYTLVVGDATKTVRLNNASTVTLTVPKSVFSAGDVITLFRKGAGGVTISPVDSDVTINSVGTKRKLASQYSAATLICVTGGATPEFDLIGDLTA